MSLEIAPFESFGMVPFCILQ